MTPATISISGARRSRFAAWVGLLLLTAALGFAQAPSGQRLALYAATGAELTQYNVDTESATLAKRASLTVPGAIQYAWAHPSKKYLYVAWSNPRGNSYGISTVQIDAGTLKVIGTPASIAARPIHISVDIPGTHVLVVYNSPSMLTVHTIKPDGTVGEQIAQRGTFDFGVYAHQVRVDPSNKTVILVTRGNGPEGDHAEDPGAIRVFRYNDGLLASLAVTAPGKGMNYQPRHLDFHPAKPWVYVSLERQNKLHLYERKADGSLGADPLFVKDSLADPARASGQLAGTVHVHPNGRFVYQANRATNTQEIDGKRVFSGGENSIAVYSINPVTGEPVLIQSADTHGFSPRTFTLDPEGRFLVAANQMPLAVSDGGSVKQVPANLAVFRIRKDGRLEFMRTIETSAGLIWAAIVPLP